MQPIMEKNIYFIERFLKVSENVWTYAHTDTHTPKNIFILVFIFFPFNFFTLKHLRFKGSIQNTNNTNNFVAGKFALGNFFNPHKMEDSEKLSMLAM